MNAPLATHPVLVGCVARATNRIRVVGGQLVPVMVMCSGLFAKNDMTEPRV